MEFPRYQSTERMRLTVQVQKKERNQRVVASATERGNEKRFKLGEYWGGASIGVAQKVISRNAKKVRTARLPRLLLAIVKKTAGKAGAATVGYFPTAYGLV